MLSKSKHLYFLSPLTNRACLQIYTEDFCSLSKAFCFVSDPQESDESPGIAETPDLPGWVKVSDKNTATRKTEDDFVPPSVSYWIENHKIDNEDVNMKIVVSDIVESDVDKISKILKNQFKCPVSVVEALNRCDFDLPESSIEQILKRFSSQWIPAFGFFKWSELQKHSAHSPNLYNLMVDNLGKNKKFDRMWELFEEMRSLEGYVTLNTMSKAIRRLAKAGKYEDSVEAFRKMDLFGIEKDVTSMNLLMDSLVKQGSVEHAEGVFLEFKEQIPPNLQTYNVLVHGWCKLRRIDKANKMIDEMKAHGFSPDTITYTNFIEAYCREKDFRRVDSTLEKMREIGLCPSIVTYTIIVKTLAKAKDTNKAFEMYENMKQNNCSPDAAFYSVFIHALNTSGRLKDSDTVFEDMSKQGIVPDLFTYNTLITISAQNLQEEKALKLLMQMEENTGCKPDLNTYAPLLKMCCRLKRMKVLSFLLSHMFKNDVSIDLGTYSLLVSRMCRNEKVDVACSFFEESVLKGFVPMSCTYKNLVEELEKKGMHKEKQRIQELMSSVNCKDLDVH